MRKVIAERSQKTIRSGAIGSLLFILSPVVSYILFEYVTGDLLQIPFLSALLNILWMSVFYLLVFLIGGTTRAAISVVSFFLFVVSLAETFVMSFRSMPIMLWDVLAFRTAMTVAGNYVFDPSIEMVIAGIALLLWNVLCWLFPVRVKGWKHRLLLAAGGTGGIAAFILCFYLRILPAMGLEINMWEMADTYEQTGYILSTAVSVRYMIKKRPAGYSPAKLRRMCSQIQEELVLGEEQPLEEEPVLEEEPAGMTGAEGDIIHPVNLICIMNESLADLKVAGDFTTDQPYLPFIDSLTENTVRGNLCVPVFGAMTSNTEFEFLLGDSMALLPTNVVAYQFYVQPGVCSLVSTLADQGYHSIAIHPYPGENWNRDRCYTNMGFDGFLEWDTFKDASEDLLRNYISDWGCYKKIIDAVENKETPEDRLFIFNVTMQNHGGYEEQFDNFPQEVSLTGPLAGRYPKADQYLSLMKESDTAFQELLAYFEDYPEPTMIVMFGDHQPGLEDEFYDEIAGRPSFEVPDAERLMWYQTPFIIWTNYQQPARDMGELGAIYLSSYVLDLAGLDMPLYNQFLFRMSQDFPVVHPIGCYARDGSYYSWDEAQSARCPYQSLVQDYAYMVYNHSMDRRTVRELFALP